MMLRWIFYVLSSVWMVSIAHAYTAFGVCNFGKESVANVVCYGPAVLKDTTVAGDVKVAGSFLGINVTMAALTVTGSVDIQHGTVKGLADLTGNVNALGVTFKKSVTVTAANTTLSHTTIGGEVTINSPTTTPYLKIQCGSTVAGSVTFVGAEGVVQITDDSVVQGKIINGTIEFVKKTCS